MSNPTGFLEHPRLDTPHRDVAERLNDYCEVNEPMSPEQIAAQAERCMDCGIPFCHNLGCPLANRIPEFNEMVYYGRWEEACAILHMTNNFPEFTGRICPAPCEMACTLNLDQEPVSICHIELQIIEKGFEQGWIVPKPAAVKTGKAVAVIGGGPAGMATAQQLARQGHDVTLFEKDERIGGLLRYGIPDFKLDKSCIDRRMDQMQAEGVTFRPGTNVGVDITAEQLTADFDAVVLTMGAGAARDLPVPGRDLRGTYLAMDFLTQQNQLNHGVTIDPADRIDASGKTVIVIGGGDTGSDCVGTSNRQGASKVYQFEIMPKPPARGETVEQWPDYPRFLRTSTSHEEGCERDWNIMTKELRGEGKLQQLVGCKVDWQEVDGRMTPVEVPGSEFTLDCDLIFLAMGFVHVQQDGIVTDLGCELDGRGNVQTNDDWATSVDGVFAAGDAQRGASLVVHAINEGRLCADAVGTFLKK
ncbi:MAG: glutamate synthase subunit beta [Phycisphaerales bacterium]|jgi:glutamate synthase (NADPH) small chain|nr:glutamate synthase subunit beta [Phycisphaerales bacterium]MBT7170526.1 glutamate synthase subunit beta [Phycisphaerales bacterium]